MNKGQYIPWEQVAPEVAGKAGRLYRLTDGRPDHLSGSLLQEEEEVTGEWLMSFSGHVSECKELFLIRACKNTTFRKLILDKSELNRFVRGGK